MVKHVEFFHGAIFGPKDWDLRRDVDAVKKLAKSWGATGIEFKIEGVEPPERRGMTYLPPEKVDARAIEDLVKELKREQFALNLHGSKFIIPLILDPKYLGFEFLTNFEKVIVHQSYEREFVQALDERITREEMGYECHSINREQVLLENHTKSKTWLTEINKIILGNYQRQFGGVFDIGHFFLQFYKEEKYVKELDDPKEYFRYALRGGRELNYGFLNQLAAPIQEVHAHGCRPAGTYTRDHCLIDNKVMKSKRAKKIYAITKYIIQRAPVEIVNAELSTDFQKADNATDSYKITKQNFKKRFLS